MNTPTLHDDRVDKMRMSVMHRVDQDVTRRGRRARTVIGLSAASVLVVGLGGYTIAAIDDGGGYSSSGISTSDSGGDRSDVGASSAAEAQAPQLDSGAGNGNLNEDGSRAAKQAAPDADRDVVTTGSASVTVTNPRATVQKLSTWIESIGGRVDERSESGTGDDSTSSVTIRVPSNQVTTTIKRLSTYGVVDDVSLQNSDVTAQTTDLDARIDALRISIDRLTAILQGATSSKDVLSAEKALTQRQEQLESLEAQSKGLADQVSLSTLTVSFSQRDRADSVEPGGFSGGLRDGWNGLIATVNRVVEVAGVLLPWAVIAAVLLLAGRLVARRRGWN